jgi:hypothetical protein
MQAISLGSLTMMRDLWRTLNVFRKLPISFFIDPNAEQSPEGLLADLFGQEIS